MAVTIYAELETYGRYGDGGEIRHIHATGHDEKYAMFVLLEMIGTYLDFESIKEWEDELEREVTVKEIVENLESSNGDGCDYIFLLKNETTGEILMKEDYFTEDEYYSEDDFDFTY